MPNLKILAAIGAFFFLALQGCTCCAYFNHAWNMEDAYDKATEIRVARQDTTPNDTVLKFGKERELYDRVIQKGSRTVERFPKNENQVPKAVFMMGEAFRHKGEWKNAIEKYDELERYFPQYDSMPKAEYERAYCFYKNAEYALARFSAERVIEQGETHAFYLPALELVSLLQEREGLPGDAIASLEAVLASDFGTPWTRAKARMRLANLYYEIENYEKAREHYLNKELLILPFSDRYKAQSTAAECLLFGKSDSLLASNEYKALADSLEFKDKKEFSLTRQGEILLGMNDEKGMKILRDLAYDAPKTETASRAFFGIGDYRQRNKNYPPAILLYDSSYQSASKSKWGIESNNRKTALSRLLALRESIQKNEREKKPIYLQEFQIAELFMLKLSESDSAIALLEKMDSTLTDPSLRARAAYTRAFIYDDFKSDTSKAFPIYRKIVEDFPQTDYAKQAQINLGLQVSVKTKEDIALDAFLKAEQSLLDAKNIPLENIEESELAYQNSIALYDSVITNFKGTDASAQAMFVKASILAYDFGKIDSAKIIFSDLSKSYPKTVWGKVAKEKLQTKLSTNDAQIASLRKKVEELEISTKTQSDKYWEEAEKKEKEPPPDPKIAEDEILKNDYNTLYDFR